MKRALILVDIQNDFLPDGALGVPKGDEIIPTLNALQASFDLVVATQDFHPEDHGSFAVNHPGSEMYSVVDLHGLNQILWPVHCVQGSHGAEFASGLDMSRIARIFPKGTESHIDSYSGFYDNGRRKATGLADFLNEEEITDVFVVGLATDYCVKYTALDAISLGFKTHLIQDATRGVNLKQGDVDHSVYLMQEAGVVLMESADLLVGA